jgi:type I restriction enzyme, S subunit
VTDLKAVAIGDCVRPVQSWNPLKAAGEDEFNYIDLSAVDQERKQILEARSVACTEAPSRARQLVEEGDVLISTVRPNLNGVARVGAEHHGATASTGFCVLRPAAEKLDSGYVFQWVKSPGFVADMVSKATGASYPAVSDRIILESRIPLPPLPEQRRIAAILDQADALRAKRREAMAQLDSLKQSIFIEIFGDPIQNPMRWKVESLESVADFFAGNSLPAGVPYERQAGGHFLMKVSDMNLSENEQFITRCQSWTAAGGARSATCPAGSVVVPKRGGAISTNKKRITTRSTILDPNLMAIAPRHSLLNLSYLYQWFMRFDLASISSGSSVPQLNKQDLAPLKIQVPPLALQQAFATRIQVVESLSVTHRAALAESNALFASLQHRAFAGQLS